MSEKKSVIDSKLEDCYKELNVTIAEFRLNLLRTPNNKRKLLSGFNKLLKSFKELNKYYEQKEKGKTKRRRKSKKENQKRKVHVVNSKKHKKYSTPKFAKKDIVKKKIKFDPAKGIQVDIKVD
ncbi:hypothetical protein JW930_04880 [Candidatus Woesearchaeota archaeon]|nr:hypothetical protein [Candidatus Woesearchaeota archaeon]